MFTRCTHCDALFRVTLHQLQSSSGQVRCGQCLEVFDAFRHLSASDPTAETPPGVGAQEPDAVTPPADAEPFTREAFDTWPQGGEGESFPGAHADTSLLATDTLVRDARPDTLPGGELEEGFLFKGEDDASPSPDDGAPDAGSDMDFTVTTDESEAPSEIDRGAESASRLAVDALASRSAERAGPPEAMDGLDLPAADARPSGADAPSRRTRVVVWILATVLVLALPVQAVVFLRDDIALRMPALRPALALACHPFGCRLPLPTLTDRLVIEASELQALDPSRPHRVVLIATLRNAAPVAQAYPMVELTLTDARDQISGRRVFSPEEYLPAGTSLEAGLDADADLDIRLNLDTGTLDANGYRLFVFHH